MTSRGDRWRVNARLIPADEFDPPPKIDFPGCKVVEGQLVATVAAHDHSDASEKAGSVFKQAVSCLSLASHRPVTFEVRSCTPLGESGGRMHYNHGSISVPHRLTTEEIRESVDLFRMMQSLKSPPRHLSMALGDLQRARDDGTPFAFVHLHRGLELVREYFGGWDKMRQALLVSEKYLRYISTRRSSPEFNIAHAPAKRGPKSRIPDREVQEGTRRASEVLCRFIRHLAGEPVGGHL